MRFGSVVMCRRVIRVSARCESRRDLEHAGGLNGGLDSDSAAGAIGASLVIVRLSACCFLQIQVAAGQRSRKLYCAVADALRPVAMDVMWSLNRSLLSPNYGKGMQQETVRAKSAQADIPSKLEAETLGTGVCWMAKESWVATGPRAMLQVTFRLAGAGEGTCCVVGCHGNTRVEEALLRSSIAFCVTEEALLRCGSRSVIGSETLAEVASVEGTVDLMVLSPGEGEEAACRLAASGTSVEEFKHRVRFVV
eukprot:CAMPEP_0172156938 /NCGR_PEP_ID=MMETSP1050-20130122/3508_1 /TAXON_ID=233186 /ORGANISM="Cryptomonas curvata, Strain CCAP979/52" /LENGTH=250 /DNA_ID=CAMNT_0012826101 /DNA_START=129 /DNA_END=882 /DNA_ORIENTATION=+